MKKNLILFSLLTVASLSIGCGTINKCRVPGNYQSGCLLTGVPLLEVELYSDNSFLYSNSISGTWQVKRDTLILYAEEFKADTVSEDEFWDYLTANPLATDAPIVENGQYTLAEDCDVYLIRGKKLLPMGDDGFKKNCNVLKKLKKDEILYWRSRM